MPHATFPVVFWDDEAGAWRAEMRDKRLGKTWGRGLGQTRMEAIYNARTDQPDEGLVKRAIGWVDRHPFLAGAAVGTYRIVRGARLRGFKRPAWYYLSGGALVGALAWTLDKIVRWLVR
jgi:hypothetical protein